MKELSSLDGGKNKKTTVKTGPKPVLAKKEKPDLRPLIAFLFTLALYALGMVIYKKYPLGENSILLSDLKAQYAPFLALMKNKVGEIGSIPKDNLLSYSLAAKPDIRSPCRCIRPSRCNPCPC